MKHKLATFAKFIFFSLDVAQILRPYHHFTVPTLPTYRIRSHRSTTVPLSNSIPLLPYPPRPHLWQCPALFLLTTSLLTYRILLSYRILLLPYPPVSTVSLVLTCGRRVVASSRMHSVCTTGRFFAEAIFWNNNYNNNKLFMSQSFINAQCQMRIGRGDFQKSNLFPITIRSRRNGAAPILFVMTSRSARIACCIFQNTQNIHTNALLGYIPA